MPYERIHIYEDPPPGAALRKMAKALPGGIQDFIATRGQAYRALELAGRTFSDDEWLRMIKETPRLLRRPILTDGRSVLVGWSAKEYARLFGTGP